MKYVEKVNPIICQKLQSLTFSEFCNTYEEAPTEETNDDVKTQYNLLRRYCTQQMKAKYKLERTYKHAKGTNDGRLFVDDIGLQRIWAKFRGVLCDGIYVDLDMVNAHPTLLLHICRKNNIACEYLETYVMSRESKLCGLMKDQNTSRAEAKKLFLQSMNSCFFKTHLSKKKIGNQFFLSFDKEMKSIQGSLRRIYSGQINVVGEKNKDGRILNRLLCIHENKLLQKAIAHIKENKLGRTGVLMFDGMMIDTTTDPNTIITQLNDISQEYGVKWTAKQHDTEILEYLDTLNGLDRAISYVGTDFVDICDHLLQSVFNDKIIRCQNTVYINDGIWKTSVDTVLIRLISSYDMYLQKFNSFTGKQTFLKVSKDLSNIKEIIEFMKVRCPENNNFLIELLNKSYKKVFYGNGYYDFTLAKFVKSDYLDSMVYINREFSGKTNKKVRKEVYKRLLNPIFGVNSEEDKDNKGLLDHFMYILARAIAGHTEDKMWNVVEGLRNCGKSVLCNLLSNCFNQYVKTTNAENFAVKPKSSDPAKDRSWMVGIKDARLIFTQEIEAGKFKYLDGVLVKQFASGGDYIEARQNHKDQIEFKLQGTLFMCCNDTPAIKPTDAYERCKKFYLQSKFVEEDYPEEDKLQGFNYYPTDSSIKTDFINRSEVINEFTLMIFEAYLNPVSYPKVYAEANKALEDDNDDDIKKLINMFRITADKEDFVNSKTIKHVVDENVTMSLKKAKRLLISKGAKAGRTNKDRGLRYIKLLAHDDDDVDRL